MRIKVHPVRWWRDDATRYQPRGAYKAPEQDAPTWGIELLAPCPTFDAIDAMMKRIAEVHERHWNMGIPLKLLFPPSPGGMGATYEAYYRGRRR